MPSLSQPDLLYLFECGDRASHDFRGFGVIVALDCFGSMRASSGVDAQTHGGHCAVDALRFQIAYGPLLMNESISVQSMPARVMEPAWMNPSASAVRCAARLLTAALHCGTNPLVSASSAATAAM